MLRCLIALTAASLSAAVLPEKFGDLQRSGVSPVAVQDRPVWDEYGLQEAEGGDYIAADRRISITAYRLKDPTGAFAAFQWQRPANASSGESSANIPGGKLIIHANYLLNITGNIYPAEQSELYAKLPRIVRSSLPPLSAYLPVKGRVANSERYVLGAVSLARFEPRISESLAAFDRGAEAQFGRYRAGGQEIQLAVFSYPTPQMAMERLRKFEKLPNAVARRSGPMVAIAFPQVREAETLVSSVTYKPSLSWHEQVTKDTPQDVGRMILAILVLAAVLISASVLLGLIFGGFRFVLERFGIQTANYSLTTLNIDNK